ncbi:MAG: DUF4838 domain-containing protein [Mucilaginibacter sp.]
MRNSFKTGVGLILLCCALLSRLHAASQPVTLISNGKSNWHITALNNNKQAQFAADELQTYLLQISKVKIPFADKPGNYTIITGLKKDIPESYKALLPAPKEGYNGYSITVSGSKNLIIIAGDDGPGIIYGAYNLLERLGCRWFYPKQDANDPEVVQRSNTVTLPPSSWSMASPVKHRISNGSAWYLDVDPKPAALQLDWAMKNRYNMIGWQGSADRSLTEQYNKFKRTGLLDELEKRGMTLHGPAHSFELLLKTDDYFKDHPEWFGLRNGKRVPQNFAGSQFCWSNAQARKQYIANAALFVKDAPLLHIFASIPFDGGQACECDNCKKAGASIMLMALMGELTDNLKKIRPDLLVETIGGYTPVINPPANLDVINPAQRIIFAQWGRYHGYGYDDPRYDSKALDVWRKAAKGGLTICNYYTDNFAEPWVMAPFAKAMISDRSYFIKHKVDALYVLMWAPRFWWNHSFNGYLAGQLYYNAGLDPYKLIDDYAVNYFGKQAGPFMARYYREMAVNIEMSYRLRGGNTTDADRALLQKENINFILPALQKTAGNKLYNYRVQKAAKLHNLNMNLAEVHRLHTKITALRKAEKFAQAAVSLKQAKLQADKSVDLFYKLDSLNQGLIDSKDVSAFTAPPIRGWIDEEGKLILPNKK